MMLSKAKTMMIIGIATIAVSCGDKPAPQAPPGPTWVKVDTVKTTDASFYEEYPATLIALNQSEIRAQVTGYVTGVYFKDGQKVSKGQKLYSIDAQVYNANFQQAQANLQLQETNLMKAQKDADRYHELDKHDAIAKQQVDYADAALEAAKKQVLSAKATVNSVRANVNFATIYAPFTGTIGISNVKAGTSVVAGQTVLNTVSTDNPIAVDFALDQKDIYRFIQLQNQSAKGKDTTFSLSFGTQVYPEYGSINLIDRAVDPQTGTIKTRLQFNNDKGMLKPGMNTTVRVLNNSAKAVIVPYKAVGEQLGEYFVYVVTDSSKVTQKKVQLGKQIGSNVIVKTGLNAGEKVVVEGVQKLREGAAITTVAPKPAGPAKK
jgi:membrane fusion protein (multidrug efflux system)